MIRTSAAGTPPLGGLSKPSREALERVAARAVAKERAWLEAALGDGEDGAAEPGPLGVLEAEAGALADEVWASTRKEVRVFWGC